jgi:hypothetical protein
MKTLCWRAAQFLAVAVITIIVSGLLAQTAEAAGHPRQGRLKCNNLPPGVQANATLTWFNNMHQIKGVQQSFNCKGNALDSQPVTQPKNAVQVQVQISFKDQNIPPNPIGTPCQYQESVLNNPLVWYPPPCPFASDATFAIDGGPPPVGGVSELPGVVGADGGPAWAAAAAMVGAGTAGLAAAWVLRRRAVRETSA